jgi:hypothetical protein
MGVREAWQYAIADLYLHGEAQMQLAFQIPF